jgi:NAD-dependent SIR2 family protein deacetylase
MSLWMERRRVGKICGKQLLEKLGMIFRIWCEECNNEYEIVPINEPIEEIKPKVCPICAEEIDDSYVDDEDDD